MSRRRDFTLTTAWLLLVSRIFRQLAEFYDAAQARFVSRDNKVPKDSAKGGGDGNKNLLSTYGAAGYKERQTLTRRHSMLIVEP